MQIRYGFYTCMDLLPIGPLPRIAFARNDDDGPFASTTTSITTLPLPISQRSQGVALSWRRIMRTFGAERIVLLCGVAGDKHRRQAPEDDASSARTCPVWVAMTRFCAGYDGDI